MENKSKPLSRTENLLIQKLAGETLVYDLLENQAFCLNETSTLVWQMCDGTNSVDEIADLLAEELKKDVSEEYVYLAIDQLKENKLLDNKSMEDLNYKLSRRQLIEKAGIATAVALPLITAMAVPPAASAQSPNGPTGVTGITF